MTMAAAHTLYLVDAHSLIFQVFHALPEMTSPSGLPTNALFGFTKDMVFLRTEKKPDYLVCAFDMPGKTFRDEISPEYKAHRAPMPDDLSLQIPLIHQMLEAMRIPVVGVSGYEADDVIATLAKAGAAKGLEVLICSSDKDCRQLINDRVKIYSLRKRQVFDSESLQQDWGIRPDQVIDLQAMVGDSVDNVKGIPGIGLKTAAKLLQEYDTLDNVLTHVDEIPGAKRQENLRAAGPIVGQSRQLVTLATDVPLQLDWEYWKVQEWDAPRLGALFREWGFHRFADQVREASRIRGKKEMVPVGAGTTSNKGVVQGDLFSVDQATETGNWKAENGKPASDRSPLTTHHSPDWQATYHLVNTPEKFQAFLQELVEQPRIALDLETTSLEPRRADIVGLAFCWKPGEAWYLAVRAPIGEPALDPKQILEQLRPVLENLRIAKVNQNIKYDMQVLRRHGINMAGIAGDPMIADYLLHAGERSHNMEVLAEKHLQHQVIPITDLIGKGKKQLAMDQVPAAQVTEYAGEDVDVAWRLCNKLEPILEEQNWKRPPRYEPDAQARSPFKEIFLYDDLEIPLIEVLGELEFNGIRLDIPLLERVGEEMSRQLTRLESEIHQKAGQEFNIASLKQLRKVLFDDLNLPRKRKTAITGEASTDQETLEWLARDGHELPQLLVEHRKIAKLKGTYVDALPALVNPNTGRIHASFNQTVAATGRLSSSDPNLQNIPIRTEQGGQIRQAFLPEEGWSLITADYSQIELRLLAHFSSDEELKQAFAKDHDIHALVAAQIFGVPEAEVTSGMRGAAKTVNFGVIYGMSAFGLAQRLEMNKDEAGKFIDAYFARYPHVLAYQDQLLENCRQRGYVSTILGRRRAINGIRPRTSYRQRNQPEREAVNMEIQGSAADLIKIAMVNIHRRLKKEKRRARMLLQIHDELVFEAPPEELDDVTTLVRQEMTGALSDRLQVPLKVDLSVGPNWLDVQESGAEKIGIQTG
jgi:DNA polymerase-1